MKIRIVSGFLGAGKTTCICNMLEKREGLTGVLVNEFGDIGIDAELIQRGEAVDMVELPSGCICCTLRNDLVQAVEEIKTRINPERLIIEPSGLAVPSGILEALEPVKEKLGLEIEAIIGIVDADGFLPNLESGLFGDFYTDQLANSDIILINKVDLVSPETLQKVEEEIRKYNQSAIILHTVNCRAEIPALEKHEGIDYLHLHFDHEFDSLAITPEGIYRRDGIEQVLRDAKEEKFGHIYRAKGIFQTGEGYYNFDLVHGQINFKKLKGGSGNKFIFIGKGFDKKAVEKSLARART
ncbi:GTP-binding protein [Desulfofundulus sp. TPOSR]|uniref:CobW family GTP-binding protein n=1 Tax=Desulfofundulus sp. TPOSR TaxID=2714340 RepID=UPI00140C6C1A|nr:GTP-binding protein [Desulfofundulus sp. TPOSR]NHM26655.1 GTP-binding protein [Desulfofundulus sp. TPOSR]